MKKIAIISLNKPGFNASIELIRLILSVNKEYQISLYTNNKDYDYKQKNISVIHFNKIDDIVKNIWNTSDVLIWFVSTGIVIRKIKSLIESKITDPAVIVINLTLTQIIPLLSGHLGGANKITRELCKLKDDLIPFITTASDTLSKFSVDLYAQNKGFKVINSDKIALITNTLINNNQINLITYEYLLDDLLKYNLNKDDYKYYDVLTVETETIKQPTLVISPYDEMDSLKHRDDILYIKTIPITLGIGLNRNTGFDELNENLNTYLSQFQLIIGEVDCFASFEGKKDEKGLIELASYYNKELKFFNEKEINNLKQNFSESEAEKHFNIKGVAEPSAVLASFNHVLCIPKVKFQNITIAAAF